MPDKSDKWMRHGVRVLYHAVFPPRTPADTYHGRIDGEPWPIGRKKKRWVVRLYDMDSRYKTDYGRLVVPYTDLEHIEKETI